MTISFATADQLDALAKTIFTGDPNAVPAPILPARGIAGPDAGIDAQYYQLIHEAMLAIDGRTMATGFRYTLNVTNALQGRPRHWFLRYIQESGSTGFAPAAAELGYMPPDVEGVTLGRNSYGFTIALALCGTICQSWAAVIRMWLSNNYPSAVTAPPPQ